MAIASFDDESKTARRRPRRERFMVEILEQYFFDICALVGFVWYIAGCWCCLLFDVCFVGRDEFDSKSEEIFKRW